MEDCTFCKIADGRIPARKVYEDDTVLAFEDVDPKAPVHVLIIPKAHCESLLDPLAAQVAQAMFAAAAKVANTLGVDKSGFRAVINTGRDGGQTVHHLHMHLLGARSLTWPPG